VTEDQKFIADKVTQIVCAMIQCQLVKEDGVSDLIRRIGTDVVAASKQEEVAAQS